ncbi:uncharacterized protein LOC104584051 isoform X1 [Brachypodium distachyon]|uniref:F-box domain-containing protein n=1 Tax=Brachypodium distachyon TaxID=15368 RepID=A0A0Q3HPS4_BRADI|nr:uncharacterized protein LOC104584051 isoform X1 [Brachypodium distachyon]KQJ95474.1 hypothetical protein BRADI_3g17403v3 [Brachypodium distachyon]|eukprot:XP_014755567.1 uncharacterized protein LOC104584051 isoform X1 [Brachypodium distachyon]
MGIRSKRKRKAPTTDHPSPSRRRGNDAVHPPSPAESRNWAALPHDVLCEILSRVPQADILRSAGLACASWRRATVQEPLLWRRIDLAAKGDEREPAPAWWKAMARAAVSRSAGRCESFRGRADADFLLYLADRVAAWAAGEELVNLPSRESKRKKELVNTQADRSVAAADRYEAEFQAGFSLVLSPASDQSGISFRSSSLLAVVHLNYGIPAPQRQNL